MTTKRPCGAPDARSVVSCDRAAKHKGQHAATVDGERFYWGRASGPTKSHAAYKAAGLRRVEAHLGTEASAALDALTKRLGSNKAAIEWALVASSSTRSRGSSGR